MKKYQLMAPGPTPVPPNVLLAMARPIIHHRAAEYDALFLEVREGLKRLVQTGQEVIPACTGTGAMEAAVANTLSAGDRVIVVMRGRSAQRWLALCKAYGLTVVQLDAPHGDTVAPTASPRRCASTPTSRPCSSSTASRPPACCTTCARRRRRPRRPARSSSSTPCRASASPICPWTPGASTSSSPARRRASCCPRAWASGAQREGVGGRQAVHAAEVLSRPHGGAEVRGDKNEARFTPAVSIMVGLREVLRMIAEEGWRTSSAVTTGSLAPRAPASRRSGSTLFAKPRRAPPSPRCRCPRAWTPTGWWARSPPRTTSRSTAGRARRRARSSASATWATSATSTS